MSPREIWTGEEMHFRSNLRANRFAQGEHGLGLQFSSNSFRYPLDNITGGLPSRFREGPAGPPVTRHVSEGSGWLQPVGDSRR